MSKKDKVLQKWSVISIIEVIAVSTLFALNVYLGNSADYSDFSAILLLVIIVGIIFQVAAFIHLKSTAWRVFILGAIAFHLATASYSLFLVSFSSYAN